MTRLPRPGLTPHSAATAADSPMHYLIECEARVRDAARMLELEPTLTREAAVLYRVATRLRGERGEVTLRW
jgi:hypothetical protein